MALPASPFDWAPQLVTSLIDGAYVGERDGHRLPAYYPGNGEIISELQEADAEEVDRAVRSARRAFNDPAWRDMSVEARQAVLYRIADAIDANALELATLETLNAGIVRRDVLSRQVVRAAYNFRFFAEAISQQPGQVWQQIKDHLTFVTRHPVGVAALIAPWNSPLALASMKVASAIAFGNTCVLKPSEQTPLSLARMVEIINTVTPPGVVNLVNGRGAATGAALVDHPEIDLIAFTGGTETGRHIMQAAGRRLKPAAMELGGKSANIIFADADQERALDGALISIFSNNGQQCLAGSRILVQDSIFDEFVGRFVERAQKIRVGDPLDDATEIGPIASARHRQHILSYVDIAQSQGATLLTGGKALDQPGYFIEPTAVLAPSNSDRVCQEEIFGPFAAFVKFSDMEDAVRMANESQFGLVGYCWTQNIDKALRVSQAVRTGLMWVNTPMVRELRAPFGGVKDSGLGRDGAAASMAFFTEEKTTTLPLADVPLRKFGV
ncbi:MAG: aldehyde dehydrogenase [Brevundimonas sp.]|jgi:acyl-CoA reductase-like NAD-dependent aldehyde dehydrogenase|uniref:aldehyde dehydrogenase n=1 Tax=Brevundimonas sp. TaxID=1871086 RepID=UPI0025BF066D|nr:aldehyde dehydrogenase [Brevundimonas sp.]MCH4267439.1 aldehyde dehydrogenase [Brevundimonas sp.]